MTIREDLWQVPLVCLHDRRKVGSIGVMCSGCGNRPSRQIGDLIRRYGPDQLVSDLWKRWRCSNCGSRNVVPFTIGR